MSVKMRKARNQKYIRTFVDAWLPRRRRGRWRVFRREEQQDWEGDTFDACISSLRWKMARKRGGGPAACSLSVRWHPRAVSDRSADAVPSGCRLLPGGRLASRPPPSRRHRSSPHCGSVHSCCLCAQNHGRFNTREPRVPNPGHQQLSVRYRRRLSATRANNDRCHPQNDQRH